MKNMNTVTRVAVALVAIVAAIVSYAHMHTVAAFVGEDWRAWLLPISVDGLVIAASLTAFKAECVHSMTKLSLVVGLGFSLGANILVPFLDKVDFDYLAATVAAYPVIALGLAFEELLRLRNTPVDEPDSTPEPEPVTVPVVDDAVAPVRVVTGPAPEPKPLKTKELAWLYLRENPETTAPQLSAMFDRSRAWGYKIRRELAAAA